jgi:hypothetical protein
MMLETLRLDCFAMKWNEKQKLSDDGVALK